MSKRGCGETHQPPFFCEGWAEVPVIGLSLSHTQTFSHSHSISNPSRGCKDRGEDSVARQILENEARRTIAVSSVTDALGTSKHQETSKR